MLSQHQLNGSTAISDIFRCLRESGMTAGELLDAPSPAASQDTPSGDVQVLSQDTRMHPHERLAQRIPRTTLRLNASPNNKDAEDGISADTAPDR